MKKEDYITKGDIAETVEQLKYVKGKDLDKFVAKIPFNIKEKLFKMSYRGDNYAEELISMYKQTKQLERLEKEMDKAIKGRLFLEAYKMGGVDYSGEVFERYAKEMNAVERKYSNINQNAIMINQWRQKFSVEMDTAESWLGEEIDPSKIEYYGAKGEKRIWRYHGTNVYFHYEYSPERLEVYVV